MNGRRETRKKGEGDGEVGADEEERSSSRTVIRAEEWCLIGVWEARSCSAASR